MQFFIDSPGGHWCPPFAQAGNAFAQPTLSSKLEMVMTGLPSNFSLGNMNEAQCDLDRVLLKIMI
jgi:hypothetical protein